MKCKKEYKISTTIKKSCFLKKLEDLETAGHFIEYKEQSNFWCTRISKLWDAKTQTLNGKTEIVFLVGNIPHRFRVTGIYLTREVPEKYRSITGPGEMYAITCTR